MKVRIVCGAIPEDRHAWGTDQIQTTGPAYLRVQIYDPDETWRLAGAPHTPEHIRKGKWITLATYPVHQIDDAQRAAIVYSALPRRPDIDESVWDGTTYSKKELIPAIVSEYPDLSQNK